ncbi:MAG: class I adenylate-forming enzyme family protein [Acidimicrobiales bacterium]
MPDLVALALPGGPGFVEALTRAWEAGDAVAPLDPRLPPAATAAVLDALAPTVVVDGDGERHRRPGGRPVEEGDALVVATSGTTGRPKGVVLTHQAVLASARATSARLGVDPGSDRWLACLPLAHVGGLSVVTRALLTGTPVVVHPGFDAEAVSEAAGGGGPVTLVSLVATTMARIDPGRFRIVVLGGSAPLGVLPANAVTTYGLTETGSGVVYDGVPLQGVEVSFGAREEILLRGPMLARGYRDGSDPRTAGGWLPTGDAGGWDADGRLAVWGRLDDMVVTGGENVWPVAVEAVLRGHPGVAEVAVAGRPDPEWGQRVVAFVVPAGGHRDPPSLDGLRGLVKERLGPWAAPRELVLVDSLPRTSIGKVRRARLERAAVAGPAGA